MSNCEEGFYNENCKEHIFLGIIIFLIFFILFFTISYTNYVSICFIFANDLLIVKLLNWFFVHYLC